MDARWTRALDAAGDPAPTAALHRCVHAEGAAGGDPLGPVVFVASPRVIGRRPLGASPKLCLFRLSFLQRNDRGRIARRSRFAAAARPWPRSRLRRGGDPLPVTAICSAVLSPWTNHRRDDYGGSLENRCRFPVGSRAAVRARVGPTTRCGQMNQATAMRGGLELDEAVEVARSFEAPGQRPGPLLRLHGGYSPVHAEGWQTGQGDGAARPTSSTSSASRSSDGSGAALLIRTALPLEGARRVRDAVRNSRGLPGRALSREHVDSLIAEVFALRAVGRATIRDPELVNNWPRPRSRPPTATTATAVSPP